MTGNGVKKQCSAQEIKHYLMFNDGESSWASESDIMTVSSLQHLSEKTD